MEGDGVAELAAAVVERALMDIQAMDKLLIECRYGKASLHRYSNGETLTNGLGAMAFFFYIIGDSKTVSDYWFRAGDISRWRILKLIIINYPLSCMYYFCGAASKSTCKGCRADNEYCRRIHVIDQNINHSTGGRSQKGAGGVRPQVGVNPQPVGA